MIILIKFFLDMNNLVQNKKVVLYTFSILAATSAIISFYLNINLSSISPYLELNKYLLEFDIFAKAGGAASDLETHWIYIQILRENIGNLITYELGTDFKILSYPLHHIIISQLPFVGSDLKIYLLTFFMISLLLPILFYRCLIIKYPEVEKYKLLNLASIIYLLPAFQYSAIWGNPHISALFFLLFSIYFFLKLELSNFKKIKYLYLNIIFLALAAYTKQFYVFLFPFFFIIYLQKINFISLMKVSVFTILFSLPGVFFLTINPKLYMGFNTLNITSFPSSIIISISIIFIYLFPFILQGLINGTLNYKDLFNKINKSRFTNFFIMLLFFILSYFFYYEGMIGGGIIYKFSNIIFGNNYFLFLVSFFGVYFILFYTENKLSKHVLSILLIVTFSSGFFIFQKYFEPMFFILFLIFFDKKKIESSITKNNTCVTLYFLFYYIGINIIYSINGIF